TARPIEAAAMRAAPVIGSPERRIDCAEGPPMQRLMRRGKATLMAALLTLSALPPAALSAAGSADRAIAQSQYRLRRSPHHPAGYLRLGGAYIQKARESGDPKYFDMAEQALKKSLELDPAEGGAHRHLAYVLGMRHDFAGAAIEAEKAIALNPKDGDARGILGDAYLETGRFAEAEAAYRGMLAIEETLAGYSRLSGLKSLEGDREGARRDLEKAIALGRQQNQPAENLAWAEWQLGSDYFGAGDLAGAEIYFRQSLETFPGYHRALAGMARVRAAEKKYGAAVELYREAIAILPLPEYAAALGDVYTKLGDPASAKTQYDLVRYIGRLGALNQPLYDRELAYFYADHDIELAESLALAERELDYRQDIYAYDLLAWALLKNGRAAEARAAIEKAMKLGTRDAKLFYHAGAIFQALGRRELARQHLAEALSINPSFDLLHAERARAALLELEADAGVSATARAGREG
ncbi:MAG: tetratricopeptide repeat protein, partial [Alphaproteobacteria bacterium]